MAEIRAPRLFILAGTNGAGKSSILGATTRARGSDYFNPDEAATRIREKNPLLSVEEANSEAWHQGKRLLTRAIAERLDFNLETTLGGNSLAGLAAKAAAEGFEVRVWYVGLATAELHLRRVRQRVAQGGHSIPEADIRRRFDKSREHLVDLIPSLTELKVYDNSEEGDPAAGIAPRPRLLLHLDHGRLLGQPDLRGMPSWAKAIVIAAMAEALRRQVR
ncbi:MAG: zeta toxin family protein [Myxococcota bacterium]|nr:zeta toxin family protein [Myxococcota bacterium]